MAFKNFLNCFWLTYSIKWSLKVIKHRHYCKLILHLHNSAIAVGDKRYIFRVKRIHKRWLGHTSCMIMLPTLHLATWYYLGKLVGFIRVSSDMSIYLLEIGFLWLWLTALQKLQANSLIWSGRLHFIANFVFSTKKKHLLSKSTIENTFSSTYTLQIVGFLEKFDKDFHFDINLFTHRSLVYT